MNTPYQSLSSQRILAQRAKKRVDKTSLDYLVMALSPVMIMLLVGSLVFFLIQVFYRGEMVAGVRWIMFWFVMAIVLVTRIGIEQSSAHAGIYGAALAAATWLSLMRTHPAFLVGIVLLALVWWSVHRLVKDCTLIDDEDDSSDQGLIPSPASSENRLNPGPVPHTPSPINNSKEAPPRSTPHSPGRWVLYFSLAALPLFGLGQLVLGASDAGNTPRLDSTGRYLIVYLLAAAGLLLSTSFLGLRRYLRQKSIKMPSSLASAWLFSGAKVALMVFIIALFLPRPGGGEAWSGLAQTIDYTIQQASQVALSFNPAGKGEGQDGRKSEASGTAEESGTNADETENGQEQAGQTAQKREGQQGAPNGQNDGQSQPSQPSASSDPSSSPLLRWLVYLLIVAGASYFFYGHRHELGEMLKGIWRAFTSLFQRPSFSKKTWRPSQPATTTESKKFRAFRNPFRNGSAEGWTQEALITYTYNAFIAWGKETGSPISPNFTPAEQVGIVAASHPHLATDAEVLGAQYSLLAYGQRLPRHFDPIALKTLWAQMSLS